MTLGAILMVKEPGAKGFRVELPDNERGRSPEDLKRLDILNARLSKPPARRGRMSADDAREADLKEREELELRAVVKFERKWMKETADETEALAKLRGEVVEPRSSSGRINISSRDAIYSLLKSGRFTAEQYDCALAVRELYERRQEGLGSQMGGLGGTSSPTYDNSNAVFYGLQRSKALQKIATIERAVLLAKPSTAQAKIGVTPDVALHTLRWVCGQDQTLTSLGRGRSYERNAVSFLFALDVADGVIRGA